MKLLITAIASLVILAGCVPDSADQVQAAQQERIQQEGNSSVGMPAIKNFRERKLLKDIIELRDQDGIITYTYIVAEQTGKFVFVCNSIGFGIPASTQFTSPSKLIHSSTGPAVVPQADPNGLFSPPSADATWVMCLDPVSNKALPQYVEPKIMVMTFKLQ